MQPRALLLSASMLAAVGCSADPVPSPASPQTGAMPIPVSTAQAEAPKLTVDGEGLRWFLPGGSARPVAFGAEQDQVTASVEGLRGAAKKATNQDCGAGPAQFATWDEGLSLVFQDGKFVGWGLDTRASGKVATAAGVGPGTTRADLEAAYAAEISETTLGTEFAAGELYGLFDGPSKTARITDMWAGVSCFAR